MSSQIPNNPTGDDHGSDQTGTSSSSDDTVIAGTPVVVRRNAGLAALIGAAASAIAIGYLWRASQSGQLLDWALCVVLAGIAGFYLTHLVDSRTPLLVADDLGVRIRLGNQWRGLPWDAVDRVVVQPRRGILHDGRLVFAPRNSARALDGLDGRGRRHASLNQKMYGASLAVPMGMTTRISTHDELSMADELAALALGRAEVVEVAPEPAKPVAASPKVESPEMEPPAVESPAAEAQPFERPVAGHVEPPHVEADPAMQVIGLDDEPLSVEVDAEPDEHTSELAAEEDRPARRSLLGGLGTIVSRVAKGRGHDVDGGGADLAPAAALAETPASWGVVPLRPARPALRAEVTREQPASLGNAALQQAQDEHDGREPLPEGRELRRPGSVDLVFERPDSARVRPISELGDPVAPLVIDDFVTEPAYDPVIGPDLAAARTRIGLSVDELADRTRIRPHVIESIEVDDFAPCGGDFYARGHLRTLARVLGQDVDPMLEKFDNLYATAPVNARRVFEAELATGMTGSMRSTIGGPNWGLLIGVVLSLVLVWGVVRLFAGGPADLLQTPPPVLNGSAGVTHTYSGGGQANAAKDPLAITLVAAHARSHVVVRDGKGRVVYTHDLVLGQKKTIKVTPPVHVSAADAGAIEVHVKGRNRGVVGELGHPGHRTFHQPAH